MKKRNGQSRIQEQAKCCLNYSTFNSVVVSVIFLTVSSWGSRVNDPNKLIQMNKENWLSACNCFGAPGADYIKGNVEQVVKHNRQN